MHTKYLVLIVAALAMLSPLSASASVSLATPNTTALSTGLVGYWPLDGNTTSWTTDTTQDLSGNANIGSLVSMSTTSSPVAGKIGQALKFNGTNQYISIPDSSSLKITGSAITISAWIDPNALAVGASLGHIVGAYSTVPAFSGYGFAANSTTAGICSNDNTKIAFWDGTAWRCSNTGVVSVNTWVLVTVVSSGGTVTFYKNGVAVGNSADSSIPSYTGVRSIGARVDGTQLFNGSIDDVRIYNRALSAQEVALLYALDTVHDGNTPAVNSSFSIASGGLSSGLIGYWPLDGNTTSWKTDTTQDLSGNNNTGSLVSMSTTSSPVAGKIGQALKFNGVSGYITAPTSSSLNPSAVTLSAWVKTTSTTCSDIVNKILTGAPFSGYALRINSTGPSCNSTNGNIAFWDGNAWSTVALGAGAFGDNKWHLLTATSNGSTYAIYVDGIQKTTGASTAVLSSTAPVDIGLDPFTGDPGTRVLSGTIDDVRIYNRALSAQEVEQLYSAGTVNVAHSNTVTLSTGLVDYLTFDGPNINWRTNTAIDSSGNGNTAKLVGMATSSSPTAGKIGQALKFNGSSSYVDSNTKIGILASGNGSVCLWAKNQNAFNSGATDSLVDQFSTNEFGIVHFNNNFLYAGFNTSGVDHRVIIAATAANWPQNIWTQYCVTWISGGTTTLYVNAISQGTTSGTVVSSDNVDLRFGYFYFNGAFYKGSLDDVRIYNRALSAQEVQQLYQVGR